MDALLSMLLALPGAAVPLALAALGLSLGERAGVVNLGAEGMMLVGAVAGFACAVTLGPSVGLLAGAAAGLLLSLVFSALTVGLGANPYASGLAVTLLGAGLSAFAGAPYAGLSLPPAGGAGGGLVHPVVWLPPLLAVGLHGFLSYSHAGLLLRAAGNDAQAARALGHPVALIRTAALAVGGLCCGLGGAYLSVVHTQLWSEGMVAGRGWMALALVVFGAARPGPVLAGAYLFGGLTLLQFHLQGEGVAVASQWLSMLPYLSIVAALALLSRRQAARGRA